MEKVQFFVLTNREIPNAYSDIYSPLYLGTGWEQTPGSYYENTGINIAEKHELYADLGGFYWIWKNARTNIVGIVQYRKYFLSEWEQDRFIQEEEVRFLLSQYDILVPVPMITANETIYDKYRKHIHIEDLEIARDILEEKYPEYLEGFHFIMGGNRIYGYNMWIARKTAFDRYCSWVFPVLQEAERRVNIENYTQDMKRVLAFLSEYLFSVWLLHEDMQVYELPLCIVSQKGTSPEEEVIRILSQSK